VWLVPRALFRKTACWKLPLFWLGSVTFSVTAALIARTFFMQAFKIPGGSMQPGLMAGDHLFVNMRAFHAAPRRGQLAVFTSPEHADQDFLKRVIALPGDRLSVSGGHPTINGWPVPHCRVGRARLPELDPSTAEHGAGEVELEFLGDQAFLIFNDDRAEPEVQGPWLVSPGEVFVLGDNRGSSSDSRVWFNGRGGGVPLANLIGQPMFVWLAIKLDGSLDWSRYGLPLDEPALGDWAPELAAALRSCLAKRPPQNDTEPPPPAAPSAPK
jgi:signal peptidase I